MSPLQRALAVSGIIGAGMAAGFLSYRLQQRTLSGVSPVANAPGAASPSPAVPSAAMPAAAGEAAPALPESEETLQPAPRAVPATLPDLALPDLAGHSRTLRSFSGRPLIINFWATWCEPCRREIPLLRSLRQRYQPDRLEIVGIALDFGSAVQQFLRRTPIDYPVLLGEQQGFSAAEQFGVQTVLPFSVFVDTAGGIVAIKIGELHPEEADFILTQIRAIDRGELGMAQARERIDNRLRELSVERAKAQQKPG